MFYNQVFKAQAQLFAQGLRGRAHDSEGRAEKQPEVLSFARLKGTDVNADQLFPQQACKDIRGQQAVLGLAVKQLETQVSVARLHWRIHKHAPNPTHMTTGSLVTHTHTSWT